VDGEALWTVVERRKVTLLEAIVRLIPRCVDEQRVGILWSGTSRAKVPTRGDVPPGVKQDAQFIESQAQADYEKNITEFAEQCYDMIITVGYLAAA